MYTEVNIISLLINAIVIITMFIIYKTKMYKTKEKQASLITVSLFIVATIAYVATKILFWTAL
ncbi:hypothetical protein [Listeria booriae]|uniref:Uncharacterized protein n=1 Tax=Listeria booriae TaxID=1552123 RepID=A0A7X0XRL7_9LIST|nr:hypothetical protein [Listeria booriae]MBC1779281.1 hypothetical protein [Listeria booriae]MBC2175428.1 hypothetical protein [Listeria booriae]MBC2371576.1 hypothetical protein [Listeria booriae]MDT0111000.1 hypothetical protein [Listeria booriae]